MGKGVKSTAQMVEEMKRPDLRNSIKKRADHIIGEILEQNGYTGDRCWQEFLKQSTEHQRQRLVALYDTCASMYLNKSKTRAILDTYVLGETDFRNEEGRDAV